MTRVMIIGNAGGGKSALSALVCRQHGLPYYEIDQIQWKPGWKRTSQAEYDAEHWKIVSSDRWVIDGFGSWSSIESRLDACDTVIFVDLPFLVHVWWATKRQISSVFFSRPDGPPDSPMWHKTIALYQMMWWLHKEMRPQLAAEFAAKSDAKRIVHLRSVSELDAFAANPV